MYARSNTLQGKPAAMDDGIAYVRDEVMPMVRGVDGCVGLSMLADRDSGRCIVTTAWETEDAMHASDAAMRDSRARAAEVFGSAAAQVEEWEVALVHRAHEGHDSARARVIRSDVDAGGMDRLVDDFRSDMLARVEALPGFCSLSMMVDRRNGRCALTVTYEDADALMRADDQAAALRREAQDRMGMRMTEVSEYDLVLHHLRVPEMV